MYTITINNGEDIVTMTCPIAAVEFIQDTRRAGYRVTYTGDPFADVAAMIGHGY